MRVQKIDRRSYVLHKELMEKVRADAELELKKQMRARSVKERAKLRSFLKNIQFLGDIGKAAANSRVNRKLLDKPRFEASNQRLVPTHRNSLRIGRQIQRTTGISSDVVAAQMSEMLSPPCDCHIAVDRNKVAAAFRPVAAA
jgi:hypothetical protein